MVHPPVGSEQYGMNHTIFLSLRQRRRNLHQHRRSRQRIQWSSTLAAAVVVLIVVASVATVVEAYPGAAGACPGNSAAVADEVSHGAEQAIGQTLAEAGMSISIHPPELVAFRPTVVTLSSVSSNTTFRGFLMRMESQDDDEEFSFEPLHGSSSIQGAVVCEGIGPTVAGLTHTFNDDKTIVSAEFIPSSEGEFVLDVTVVESNTAPDGSRYSYGQLLLSAAATGSTSEPMTNTTAINNATAPQNQTGTFQPDFVPTTAPMEAPTAVPARAPVPVGNVPTVSTFPPTFKSSCRPTSDVGRLLVVSAIVFTTAVLFR